MKIKYLHFRYTTPDVIKEGTYQPGRVLSTGGMCVAYQLDDNYQVLGFAIARCHKHDNYNKEQGRVKATGRLLSPTYFVQTQLDEQEFMARMHSLWDDTQGFGLAGQNPPANV
jgi:hypothetical protein